jgi:hypothetical protein
MDFPRQAHVTSASWPDIERITPATDPQALMTSSPTWKSSSWKPDSSRFLDHRSFLGAIRLERGQGPVKHVSVCFEPFHEYVLPNYP